MTAPLSKFNAYIGNLIRGSFIALSLTGYLTGLAISSAYGQSQSSDDMDMDMDMEPEETTEPPEIDYIQYSTARLRALDKITGRSTDMDISIGAPITFGTLKVELSVCYQTPPELPPESAAFLKVFSTRITPDPLINPDTSSDGSADISDVDTSRIFSGWMFASSPGLSALEHPIYDVWVIRCISSAPLEGTEAG